MSAPPLGLADPWMLASPGGPVAAVGAWFYYPILIDWPTYGCERRFGESVGAAQVW